jgi:hypothetical protein
MTVENYIEQIPADRKDAFLTLRKAISDNLPAGFQEGTAYGMICYSVPLATFPAGYHCAPGTPLPFISIASQKNFLAVYHMGIYACPDLLQWFTEEYPKHAKFKLDMGKSCIRFKKMNDIPFALIAELATKMTPEEWVAIYQKNYLQR